MRLIGRVLVGLVSFVVLAAAVYGAAYGVLWLAKSETFDRAARQPDQPVALSSLGRYTKTASKTSAFRRYFTTMAISARADTTGEPPVITRWERPRVGIALLNDGGPGVEAYIRRLAARLDRMQSRVRFVVSDASPRITIKFLTHAEYVRVVGTGSVGSTSTRYYRTSPGLIRARIFIDTESQADRDDLKSTLIHELTHAIGCGGHFTEPSDRRRSVLYKAGQITSWSQNDAAVIRLLYSSWIEVGMTAEQARAALRQYARSSD